MRQPSGSRSRGSSMAEALVRGKRFRSAAGMLAASTIGTSSAESVENQRTKSRFQRAVSMATGR